MTHAELSRIQVSPDSAVSAVFQAPSRPVACFVMAHGAGAGMRHSFMEAAAQGLADRGVATLRYQFPYMEAGSKRPDRPAVAQATVRAAVATAAQIVGALPLVAGGKSFGGRMTSQAQAAEPLPRVRGLAFLGFPLHPPDKPSNERAAHLGEVKVPMLFIQGTRDRLAETTRIDAVVAGLGPTATLYYIEHADHGFDVLVRSGRTGSDAMTELLDALSTWIHQLVQID